MKTKTENIKYFHFINQTIINTSSSNRCTQCHCKLKHQHYKLKTWSMPHTNTTPTPLVTFNHFHFHKLVSISQKHNPISQFKFENSTDTSDWKCDQSLSPMCLSARNRHNTNTLSYIQPFPFSQISNTLSCIQSFPFSQICLLIAKTLADFAIKIENNTDTSDWRHDQYVTYVSKCPTRT